MSGDALAVRSRWGSDGVGGRRSRGGRRHMDPVGPPCWFGQLGGVEEAPGRPEERCLHTHMAGASAHAPAGPRCYRGPCQPSRPVRARLRFVLWAGSQRRDIGHGPGPAWSDRGRSSLALPRIQGWRLEPPAASRRAPRTARALRTARAFATIHPSGRPVARLANEDSGGRRHRSAARPEGSQWVPATTSHRADGARSSLHLPA